MKFFKNAELKLPKILKDILLKLMKKADWNEELYAKIQTVEIIHVDILFLCIVKK